MDHGIVEPPRFEELAGGRAMQTPDDVQAMLQLASLGWGTRRIAVELGCSRNTVKRYVSQGNWREYRAPERTGALEEHAAWLQERFVRHRGNCDVVRQDLQRELGLEVSLRTVQRALVHLRQQIQAQVAATIRFETPPGHQLQIDFGTVSLVLAGQPQKVHLFVATLGYSRRTYVAPFLHQRQSAWFEGLEGAFRHFGGTTKEVLLDNARALVDEHDALTREVRFNDRFRAFCRHWGVTPRACAPYRARTKGKDERGVGYVKRNAIAGHQFASLDDLQGHLMQWMRDVADVRVHGTTGERPIERFDREERAVLGLLANAPFEQLRELTRRVHTDACVELDTNRYSVPWRLIGETVTVIVSDQFVRVSHAGQEVACHGHSRLRRTTWIEREHLAGIVGSQFVGLTWTSPAVLREQEPIPAQLLRPLQEYEQMLGGGW